MQLYEAELELPQTEVSTAPVHLSGKLAAIFNACLKRERRRAAFPCGAVPNGRTLIEGFREE